MKTLIIYASTYGYTSDCVKECQKKLNGEVITVDIMSDAVPPIDAADNIIIGGSIYMGQIQKKLKLYCISNLEALLKKRVALFLCCGSPENFEETLKASFPEDLIKKAVAKECLGGELRVDRMKLGHRMIAGFIKKETAKQGKSEMKKMPENIAKLADCINGI